MTETDVARLLKQDALQREHLDQHSVSMSFSLEIIACEKLNITGAFAMQKTGIPQRTSAPRPVQRLRPAQDIETQETQEYEYDDNTIAAMPRSALRHRPINTDRHVEQRPQPRPQAQRSSWYQFKRRCLWAALWTSLIFYMLDVFAYPLYVKTTEQWQYGAYPTSHIEAELGHGGVSHLTAFMLNNKIEIIEITGNHTTRYEVTLNSSVQRVITLTIADVNLDGKMDVLIHIEGMTMEPCLLNAGSTLQWGVSR